MIKMKMGLAAAIAATGLMTVVPVQAVEVQTGAAGACKSALPAFDGNIRTRPLAMQNEGSAAAFVSCSNSNVHGDAAFENTVVGVYIQNQSAATQNVSCTFVDGRLAAGPEYFPKAQSFPAGGSGFIVWTAAADNGGEPFTAFANFSCQLNPGVGISRIAYVYPGPAAP